MFVYLSQTYSDLKREGKLIPLLFGISLFSSVVWMTIVVVKLVISLAIPFLIMLGIVFTWKMMRCKS